MAGISICLLSQCEAVRADDPQVAFLTNYCYDCHSAGDPAAGLDLENLVEHAETTDFESWVRVLDRVADREMPPPEDSEPIPVDEFEAFTGQLKQSLVNRERTHYAEVGRVPARRLTNLQLERTLQDLLGIDIPLEREMPEEPKSDHYTTLASAQTISHFHLQQHIKIVDMALDEAFRRALSEPDERTWDFSAKDISRTRSRTREPEFIDGQAVVWSGRLIFYGRLPATTARESGWYRFQFEVEALKKPKDLGVWCSVRTGQCVSSAPLMDWVGSFEATNEPKVVTFDAWLPKGHLLEVRPADQTLKQARFRGGQSANGEGGSQDVPGLAINWMKMERIHRGESDASIRKTLFGELELKRTRRNSSSRSEDPDSGYQVVVSNPQEAGRELIGRFAEHAFRSQVDREQLQPFYSIFDSSLEKDVSFIQSLRAAYRAVLCSARFLYLQESPGELDDYAIATRLSYLIWNSLPDKQLLRLAKQGKLRDPKTIKQEVARMLKTRRGQEFVADFSSQWLELSEIDFTSPDRKLYPKFDMVVQRAMLDETHAFLQDMLDENRSVALLADSDYTFANSRLARFYGIEGDTDDVIRRIDLNPEDHRGGLLAQGAILKVTANGTNTSPVLRGLWVARRILGRDIPEPPASVPAIEPDIRGATTIREQLEKHRSMPECAGCHRKIDPPGFALESFDAAGQWREYYPRQSGKKIVKGAKIDPSYTTASGESFKDFAEYRALVGEDLRGLARNLARQLVVYGTGAEIGLSDRDDLDVIVDRAAKENFGLRSILEEVVTSRIFLTK